jgi:hypothetical protein
MPFSNPNPLKINGGLSMTFGVALKER